MTRAQAVKKATKMAQKNPENEYGVWLEYSYPDAWYSPCEMQEGIFYFAGSDPVAVVDSNGEMFD